MGEAKRKKGSGSKGVVQETLKRMSAGQHDYGDAPVQESYREQMVAIMQTLNEFMNEGATKKTAIVVMMFPFGEDPHARCNYMSNGVDRKDLVVLMKEMIARFEGMPGTPGRA